MPQGGTGRSIVQAFLDGDAVTLQTALASDGTFHSPVADYTGPGEFGPVFEALVTVVGDARLVSEIEEPGQTVAFFTATIAGRPADAVVRVIADGDAPATDVTLMIRPLETLIGAVKAMQQALGL
jgi:hypothetical protein